MVEAMSWDRVQAETEAFQSLVALYESAKQCKLKFDRAHMAPPEPLRRFLDIEPPEPVKPSPPAILSVQIPRPEMRRPGQATDEWIGVRVRDCRPQILIPAILAGESKPLRSVDVVKRTIDLLDQTVVTGSVYNAIARLIDHKSIDKTEDGFLALLKPGIAGLIYEGYVWGPQAVFLLEELAAHRREAIVHILGFFSAGLELVQIVEQLRNSKWMKAPANKSLLKADLDVLEREGKIRRRGNTRKWEIVPPEKGGNSKAE